jgi:hypothetical protein
MVILTWLSRFADHVTAVTVNDDDVTKLGILLAIRRARLCGYADLVGTLAILQDDGTVQLHQSSDIFTDLCPGIIEVLPVSVLQRLADLATETPWLALTIRFVIAYGHLHSFA